jgi:hypothetical protein
MDFDQGYRPVEPIVQSPIKAADESPSPHKYTHPPRNYLGFAMASAATSDDVQ